MLRKTFPFEGNWNRYAVKQSIKPVHCWGSPSRLKGIETIYGVHLVFPRYQRLESPSRLKGIETQTWRGSSSHTEDVQKAFPVWRELKLPGNARKNTSILVEEDLPVWRELKQSAVPVVCFIYTEVRKDLPVWRELKHDSVKVIQTKILCWGSPSRLKGIETTHSARQGCCQFVLWKPFPFEGNWNLPWRTLFWWIV